MLCKKTSLTASSNAWPRYSSSPFDFVINNPLLSAGRVNIFTTLIVLIEISQIVPVPDRIK